MRFSIAAVASLLAVAQAKINGISLPATIQPGQGFNLIIESSDFIQSIYDVSIAVGYATGAGYPGDLGTVLGSYYLGPGMFFSLSLSHQSPRASTLTGRSHTEQSNQLNNFPKWVQLPAGIPLGQGVISASLFSLVGAAAGPTLSQYNVTVTFGTTTSSNLVSSS